MEDRERARKQLARLIDAYNDKDRDALADLYAEDISLWSALGTSVTGREVVLAHIDELFEKLPDERMTADVVATDGDTVVVELTSRGTDRRGAPYELRFTEVLELTDGRFSEIRTYLDPDVVEAITG